MRKKKGFSFVLLNWMSTVTTETKEEISWLLYGLCYDPSSPRSVIAVYLWPAVTWVMRSNTDGSPVFSLVHLTHRRRMYISSPASAFHSRCQTLRGNQTQMKTHPLTQNCFSVFFYILIRKVQKSLLRLFGWKLSWSFLFIFRVKKKGKEFFVQGIKTRCYFTPCLWRTWTSVSSLCCFLQQPLVLFNFFIRHDWH